MEANGKRKLKSGREYDHLFPKPTGKDHTIKRSADVEDTLKFMRKSIPETLWQTKKIARVLKGRTLKETCANIWQFVYDHIEYERDKAGVEQIRSPRRTWWDRKGDCDCFTQLISSMLSNLGIPHILRIAKYPKEPPTVPHWQHIYLVVPPDGKLDESMHYPIVHIGGQLNGTMRYRNNYIVMDCVKEKFDDEEPYIECKDYDMRLDYLDGIDDTGTEYETLELGLMGTGYSEPASVDLADIASVHYDSEEMGNIFKKIVDAHKKVITKVADGHKKVLKVVAKKGIHFLNRFTNPGTILIRNGFLLATKLNLFNIGGRLRYAYLTDEQAKARGIDLNVLKHVRKIKDKAEQIYFQAGGNKSNFKKAVLKGRGNKKGLAVPLHGLSGFDDYADEQEYNILHTDEHNLNGLGEIDGGASIAAAMSLVGAIARSLKQVKGLFIKGGHEEQSFQSETDNAGTAADAKGTIPDSDDEVRTDTEENAAPASGASSNTSSSSGSSSSSFLTRAIAAARPAIETARTVTNSNPSTATQTPDETAITAEDTASDDTPARTTIHDTVTQPGGNGSDDTQTPSNLPAVATQNKTGLVEKTTLWIKEHPVKTAVIAGAIVGSGLLLVRAMSDKKQNTSQGMNGIPSPRRKQKTKKKNRQTHNRSHHKKQNITFTKLF